MLLGRLVPISPRLDVSVVRHEIRQLDAAGNS